MATESIEDGEGIGSNTEATVVPRGSTAIHSSTTYEPPALNPELHQVVDEVIAGEQPVSDPEGQIVGLDVRSNSLGTHRLLQVY
jgi:hypothetical protein